MSKPKLLFRVGDMPNFSQGWIRPLVEKHFDMIEWDASQRYPTSHIVLATYQQDFLPQAWFRDLEQAGNPVIIDHLFDSDVDTPSRILAPKKLELRSGHWLWYRTALLAAHFGYNQYTPQRKYTHDFLCLMNKIRDHRDRVQTELQDLLQHARWSYVDRGKQIGDPQERQTPVFWEYYMNPQWYDSTCWHFVIESYMRSDSWFASPTFPNYKTEISEKSYKPLAYYQPFVVCGSVDTLQFLRNQGFETFDNLWPESYDTVQQDRQRADTVFELVRDIVKIYNKNYTGWDRETTQRLEHNHNRFFDIDLITQKFHNEIIGDIQEFLSRT